VGKKPIAPTIKMGKTKESKYHALLVKRRYAIALQKYYQDKLDNLVKNGSKNKNMGARKKW